jgi:diguanylate cyclase (GGDEF)-like protein
VNDLPPLWHRDLTGRQLAEPAVRNTASRGRARPPWCAWPLIGRRTVLAVLKALLIISVASTSIGQSTALDTLLVRADELRSADPQAFRDLLVQVEQRIDEATPAQREHLRYLQTYRMSLDGQFAQAIAALRELAETTPDTPTRFRALTFLANNYAHTRDFAAGLEAMDGALALLPEIEDRDLRHQGMLTAAILYNQAGQHVLALTYAQETLEEAASGRSRCIAGIMKLEAQFALGELPADDAVFDRHVAVCESNGEALLAEFAHGYKARSISASGDHLATVALLERRMGAIEATAYPRLIAEMQALLASEYLIVGQLEPARRFAKKVIAASDGVEFSLPLVTAYRVLAQDAEQRGDLAAALDYQRRHAEADKAYLDDIKARELAFQFAQHDNLQKTQTIERLNHRNEMLRLESEVDKQSAAYNRLLLVLLVILLASIGLWAYLTKREQVRFRRLAQTDALTGISNRLHFSGEAPRILAECARSGTAAALVMFDLDAFKSINDRYGHAAGDWVLIEVARICRGQCGRNDLFARLGGEEFAIVSADADVASATGLAERCRRAIAAIDTSALGQRFPVSASFGIALSGDAGGSLDALLVQADTALYSAKSAGRNRVELYRADGADTRQAEFSDPPVSVRSA